MPPTTRRAVAVRAPVLEPVEETEVLDLDAYTSERAADSFPIRKNGRVFHLMPLDMIDSDLALEADSGRASAIIEAMRAAVIGDEQDHADMAACRFGIGELEMIFVNWLAKSKLAPGESEQPPNNFEPTAVPSRRTSSGRARR